MPSSRRLGPLFYYVIYCTHLLLEEDVMKKPFTFSRSSTQRIRTLDDRLQVILNEALALTPVDFTVIWGHRDKEAQDNAYQAGHSQVQWPNSKHNSYPAKAFDIAPLNSDGKIDWRDELAFAMLAGVVMTAATIHGTEIRWGGDWDQDGSTRDQSFMDLAHFELVED